MNAEVSTRDGGSRCALCKQSEGEVEIQAAHIFELQEREKLSVWDWMDFKAKNKIDSLYGPKNGFSACTLCHKMLDLRLLSIEYVLQDDSVRYMIDCCEGAMQDPLFAYRDHDHANNIHKNLISEPANAKM